MHWDPGPYFDWSRLMRAVSRKRAPAVPRATTRGAVTITPNYQRNRPPVSSCDSSGCQPLPSQPTNFVYLRSAPSATAPLVADPLLRDTALEPGGVGSERADDWGDKAVTGQSFAVADRRGPWTAIWYGGQKAWLYDRNGMSTTPACTRLVTPNAGRDSIPVYGRAYPQAVSTDTLGYSIGAGQRYVAEALVPADYYSARTFNQPETYKVITDETSFYEISFNHRRAFVSASDVTVVGPDCSRDVDAAARPATQSDTASSELQYLG
jgi:hypothetical protein